MRIKMAEIKNIDLDKRILAKIMILEYFKDSVYKEIGELQANQNGKPEELKLIEQNNWINVEKLKIWKDDDWFSKMGQNGTRTWRYKFAALLLFY